MFHPTTFGKYFLTRRLAVGGMAEVYAAKLYGSDGFEKDLVIKQILPQYARDPEFVQSFVAEAKIAVSLTHANVVGIYELGRVDGTYFIAMEYVDGLDAYGLLTAAKRYAIKLSVGLALLVAEEVAKGLDYAHRKIGPDGLPLGLVHRDLNPRNVLISREGDVKILDFGIAKTASRVAAMPKTRAGVVKGTSGYMSPEQATGNDVDSRTDIYQAGLLLFELLTGQALFWRPDDDATRELMRAHRLIRPGELNKHVTKELDELVLYTLERDPNKRLASAADLAQRLARLRYLQYPDATPAELGKLVAFLKDREDAAEEKQAEALPSTAELQSVISEAIAQSVTGQVETIARAASGVHDRPLAKLVTGSQPIELPAEIPISLVLQKPVPVSGITTPVEALPPPPPARAKWPSLLIVGVASAAVMAGIAFWVTPDRPRTDVALAQPPPPPPPVITPPPTTTEPPVSGPSGGRTAPEQPNEPVEPPSKASGKARTDVVPTKTVRRVRPPPPPVSSEAGFGTVGFGTRSCSSRVTLDGEVIARSTPSYDHKVSAGRHKVVIEGTGCPPIERPGSLRQAVPTVVTEIEVVAGQELKVIADFEREEVTALRRQ